MHRSSPAAPVPRGVQNPLTRFSNRVGDYVRWRPGYPLAVIACLTREFGLRPDQVVADVGSGTGISSELLLGNGHRVFGVEPNPEMRAAAEQRLNHLEHFRSIEGMAEATTLPAQSVDWVVAAQAFHWFDVDACRVEFSRLLRPGGKVVLLWNERRDDTPFLREYEAFVVAHAIDYQAVSHRKAEADGRIARLFAPNRPELRCFAHHQDFDFEGLKGRVLSSSYMPAADHPAFDAMLADLRRLHARHAADGIVRFVYNTKMFLGCVPC